MKLRALSWLSIHREQIITWSFPLIALATIISYPFIRQAMITQESRVTVTASTLTVTLLICLYIIGWGLEKLIGKYMAKRHWVLRYGAFVGAVLLLFMCLDFLGYEVKFL
jgi:hypothetical protein